MNRRHKLFTLLLFSLLTCPFGELAAQEASPPPAAAVLEGAPGEVSAAETPMRSKEATLVWWNRPIVVFRSDSTPLDPEARVADALENIEGASDSLLSADVTTEKLSVDGDQGYRFVVGEAYLFSLLQSDLDPLEGAGLAETRATILATMKEIRAARIEQGSAKGIASDATKALVATVILITALFVLRLLVRGIAGWLVHWIKNRRRLRVSRADLRPHFATLAEQLVKISGLLLALYLCCLWTAFVFNQFPLTEPLGLAFTERLKEFGMGLLRGIAASLPGLVTAGLILLIARWMARMTDRVIRGIGREDNDGILAADTAKATRRIAAACIWIFAIVLAYPYLPGSGSDAFKGVSVLLGLMVSLGSTGMINQVMSGFVLLYSGSVRTGEYIKIGDVEGTVTEMGMLAVKVLTPQKEFLTVPNAVMISNPSTNYSRLSKDTGVPIIVPVTIGYDAAWRQVHELLLSSAKATAGVVDTPEPKVIQKALSDWYAEYTLTCYTRRAEEKNAVLSELNGQIQDAFNEAGIQIMSPHYYDDKPEPLVIPKERWFPRPPAPGATG